MAHTELTALRRVTTASVIKNLNLEEDIFEPIMK
jgi:hypothetical protein